MAQVAIIVFSPNQYVRRCTYIVDEREVPGIRTLVQRSNGGRLGMFVGTMQAYIQMGPDKMLELYTGRKPKNSRCLMMNGNRAKGVIHADPLLDFDFHGLGIRLVSDK